MDLLPSGTHPCFAFAWRRANANRRNQDQLSGSQGERLASRHWNRRPVGDLPNLEALTVAGRATIKVLGPNSEVHASLRSFVHVLRLHSPAEIRVGGYGQFAVAIGSADFSPHVKRCGLNRTTKENPPLPGSRTPSRRGDIFVANFLKLRPSAGSINPYTML